VVPTNENGGLVFATVVIQKMFAKNTLLVKQFIGLKVVAVLKNKLGRTGYQKLQNIKFGSEFVNDVLTLMIAVIEITEVEELQFVNDGLNLKIS